MKIHIKGGGQVSLSRSDFVTSGGEGEIYAKGNTAYKIYIDPNHMIPEGKIQELALIKDPYVNKPDKIIASTKGKPIGYTTTFIKNAVPLCSLFPKAYRDRNSITPTIILSLIKRLQEMVDNVHTANILIVDLNEMNFLINDQYDKIYGIDVDSYQTKHFPATALMETVRDRHSKTFNEGTDWFAYAITSFQMFCGIHPYKGKHSNLKGLDARMNANISVLHPDVKVPKSILPFDVIPDVYKQWYLAVLHDGKRIHPPTDFIAQAVIAPIVKVIVSSGNIVIKDLNIDVIGNIKSIHHHFGHTVILTDEMVYSNSNPMQAIGKNNYVCAFTPKSNDAVIAHLEYDGLKIDNITRRYKKQTDLHIDTLVSYNGNLLIKSHSQIIEVRFIEIYGKILTTLKTIGNVLPQATKLYSGVAIQNLLRSIFISLFPEQGVCYQLKVPELDSYKIIEAKFDNGVLMVIGVKDQKYDRLVFRFDSKYQNYDLRVVSDIVNTGLNFVTLDTGICVCLNEEEKIEAFSSRKGSKGIKVVEDNALSGDMVLYKKGGKVIVTKNNKVYQMSMK